MQRQYKTQSQRIFDYLEMGIVLIENKSVSFMNHVFKKILLGKEGEPENLKLFRSRVSAQEFSLLEVMERDNNEIYEIIHLGP